MKKISRNLRSRHPAPVRRSGPLKVGEKVLLRTLKTDGVVTTLAEEEVEVQVGAMRVRARREDIQRKIRLVC